MQHWLIDANFWDIVLPRKIDRQIHNYLVTMQEVLKDFLEEKIYSSKIYQVFGYVLQIMVHSLVLFAMIFQTCYSIYMGYKFWCWLQSHLQQYLTKLKLASWSSSNAFVLDWEVHVLASQIRHSVANSLHHCNISSEGAVLPFTNVRILPLCYTLRHSTMSIVKDLM